MLQDLRFAVRWLRKNRRFTSVALLVLALGIGATSAVFSVVYSVLLRPLPFRDPDRLVLIWSKARGMDASPVSPPDFRDWKAQARSFESVAAAYTGQVDLTGRGEPEQIPILRVDGNLFPLLGERVALGRTLGP